MNAKETKAHVRLTVKKVRGLLNNGLKASERGSPEILVDRTEWALELLDALMDDLDV